MLQRKAEKKIKRMKSKLVGENCVIPGESNGERGKKGSMINQSMRKRKIRG